MSGPGTFFGLEIARRGLMSHQKSLEVTGHNIANANTPGYSRQEAVHKAGLPYPAPGLNSGTAPGQLGSGVEISEIRRIRNEYLDTQVRDSTSAYNFWDSRLEILEQIQSIFPEPDGRGIQEVLINFFSDWHDLNNTPQDAGIKSAVVESGKELARLFRDTYNQLQNVDKSIMTDIDETTKEIKGGKLYDQVNRINELTERIADVTKSIIRVKREGRQPNDLLDKRDALLDELAGFGPIEVDADRDTGGINVSMFGESLITTDSTSLQVTRIGVNAAYDGANKEISLNIGTEKIILNDLINNDTGSLVGIVWAWQDNNHFIDELNKLARSLADTVNAVYDPLYDPDESLPQDFWQFRDVDGNLVTGENGEDRTAGQIYVHSELISTPEKLDGTEALDVARLRNRTSVFTGKFTSPIGSNNWNLSITATGDYPILKDFKFEFVNDENLQAIQANFDTTTKDKITIKANWNSLENKLSTLAEIEAVINDKFASEGYSATISLGVEGNYNLSDLANPANGILELEDVLNLNDTTLEGYYRGYIAEIGAQTESAKNMHENQRAILDQIEGLRESTSGVSLDEELSRMIEFQYGYQASARVLSTLDDILDTLINRMAV